MEKSYPLIYRWFISYSRQYAEGADAENINLKIEHSLRVARDIVLIAKECGLSESDIHLAEICGLLHDAGRFKQYHRYKTFSDGKSIDHAKLGVQVVKRHGLLNFISPRQRDIVLTAILYHNKLHLPQMEDPEQKFFCELLRDADKLDIFKVVTDYYKTREVSRNETLELNLPEKGPITPAVLEAVKNKQDVKFSLIQNLNDFKVLQSGWIYALKFTPTIKLFVERNYLPKMQAAMDDIPEAKEIFDDIKLYLKQKLGNDTR